jgi:hypothetical protein
MGAAPQTAEAPTNGLIIAFRLPDGKRPAPSPAIDFDRVEASLFDLHDQTRRATVPTALADPRLKKRNVPAGQAP